MAVQRSVNTQEEVLRKLLNQINDAELAEDADPTYLTLLRTVIKAKLRAPIDQAAQMAGMTPDASAGLPGMGGGGMGGGMMPAAPPPGMGMAGAPMGAAGPVGAAPVPGVQTGLNRGAMNPDEMRRMLAGPG